MFKCETNGPTSKVDPTLRKVDPDPKWLKGQPLYVMRDVIVLIHISRYFLAFC